MFFGRFPHARTECSIQAVNAIFLFVNAATRLGIEPATSAVYSWSCIHETFLNRFPETFEKAKV